MSTFREALEQYILFHDLKPDTADWYRRIGSVFLNWAAHDVPISEFHGEAISRLLVAKQVAGRSSHYLRSLRNGLMALLREVRGNGPLERVRSVKTRPLDPQAWTAHEVEMLLAACVPMPAESRWRWQLVIALGYYTGLDRCDLEKLTRQHVGTDGVITCRRSKTGSLIIVSIPHDVLHVIEQQCPLRGPILDLHITPEWFRRVFKGIVKRAGLTGTFKQLRKSSGSGVEFASPGKGHKHLGNTRAIFERHYEARRLTRSDPTMPPVIRMPPPDAA